MEETLGKRIVHNRKRLGLTQDQLAEKLGVTAQAVSKWENDQSCPDITMLPKLSEIFGITTDTLLGIAQPARTPVVEVVEDDDADSGIHAKLGKWDIRFDSARQDAICFAVMVLAVGVLALLSNLLSWSASFWEILWPTALLVFGLFGIYPRFSFFRLGCALFGGFFLLEHLDVLPFGMHSGIVVPALVILAGLSLLGDALKKKNKASFACSHDGKEFSQELSTDDGWLEYSASFGESAQYVELPLLRGGKISTSFGDYKLDLSGVESLSDGCTLEAHCSFGELTLLIPRRFQVKPAASTAFASVDISGEPAATPEGILHIDAHANFGELSIRYV